MAGQTDIAVGNVVGSNIFNVLFILGVSALIVPLSVAHRLVRIDVPLLIGCSFLLALFAADGGIAQGEGAMLLTGLVAYTIFLVRQARNPNDPAVAVAPDTSAVWQHRATSVALIVLGLMLLPVGAHWLVRAATVFARNNGVSELVIGLTVVAMGTSLPEVATSVMAALRGERDIAVGNAVGSCIYNVLLVVGVTALITPQALSVAHSVLTFDLPFMIAASVACLPIFFTGYRIDRWEGAVFLGYYLCYALYVVLRATEHDLLASFSGTVMVFVLPITLLTMGVFLLRTWRPGARHDA